MRGRRIAAAMLIAALLLVGTTVTAVAQRPSQSAPSVPESALRADESTERRKQEREAVLRRRATPEERRSRRESRQAFQSLGDRAAVDVLRDRKTAVKRFGAYRALDLPDGARADKFIDDFTLAVDLGEGRHAVRVSQLPVRAKNDRGDVRPVDLALNEHTDDFRSANPLVETRFPRTLRDQLKMPGERLAIGIDANRPQAQADRIGDAVVYPNSATDTDALLQPIPVGTEISWIARSPRAPEEHRFTVGSTDNSEITLEELPGGQGIAVRRDKEITSVVLPASAYDADGEAVPASMRLEGDTVVVTARHRDADVKYPVLIDPPLIDHRDWRNGNQDFANWAYATNRPNYFSPILGNLSNLDGNGMYVGAYAGLGYNAGDYGEWAISAPRESYILRAEWLYARHRADTYSEMFAGLFDLRGGRWEPNQMFQVNGGQKYFGRFQNWTPGFGYANVLTCANTVCDHNAGAEGNLAVVGLRETATNTTANAAVAYAGGAQIWMNDRNNPTVIQTGQDMPSEWLDDEGFGWGVRVNDIGLGPAGSWIYIPVRDDEDEYTTYERLGGTPAQLPCFGHFCSTNLDTLVSAYADDLPTGVWPVYATGADWGSRESASLQWTVKVDHRQPELDVAWGDLEPWEGEYVDAEKYVLSVSARDGVNGRQESGVRHLRLAVGDLNGANEQAIVNDTSVCPDNCAKSANNVEFRPANYPPGIRTIRAYARDAKGHESEQELQVKVPAGQLAAPKSGQRFNKLIPLKASSSRTGLTGVEFQFRRNNGQSWTTVPAAKVKRPNGATLAAWPAPLTPGTPSTTLVTEGLQWDARTTAGIDDVDGALQVRAVFVGTGNTGESSAAEVQLDRNFLGETFATEEIGPGAVTLASGNLALEASDVSLAAIAGDLSVSRIYNSRKSTEVGPLGPGWTLATPVLSAGLTYTRLDVTADQSATAVLQDGTQIPFAYNAAAQAYSPSPGFKDLRLRKDADQFVLNENDGDEIRFSTSTATPNSYAPTTVSQAASSTATRFSYETVAGVRRVASALAPSPTGVTCSVTSPAAGCRLLRFVYATTTSATGTAESGWGSFTGRLARVEFVAADPATNAVASTDVAQYQYDSNGRLRAAWDPRISPALKQRYDYNANGVLSQYTPPGERAWNFAYATLPDDLNTGRLRAVTRDALPSGTATWTVHYRVPLSGTGAPYPMGAANVSAWGQGDQPTDATAIFPPTQVPAATPANYDHATVHYLNDNALRVNAARPGGRISTTEYDIHRNAVRELTPQNRVRALAAGTGSAALAAKLDTQRSFNVLGTQLATEIEPEHQIRRDSNTLVRAREITYFSYDQGAPATGGPYDLLTSEVRGARLADGSVIDTRQTVMSYDGQSNLGWRLRKPTSKRTDPNGLNLTERYAYDEATGARIERRLPSDSAGNTAATKLTTLFAAAANSTHPGCGSKPAWAGLPCRHAPAAQPASGPAPPLPVVIYEYNRLGQQTKLTETSGSNSRVEITAYDSAGRMTSSSATGTVGAAVPSTTFGYSATTGRQTTASSSVGTVTRVYDALGRLSTYTDAAGQTATYGYDIKDRQTSLADGKGTRAQTPDLNNDVVTVTDTQVTGSFTGTYDADGQLLTQTYPNAVKATWTRDETGKVTAVSYDKTTGCTSNCNWLRWTVERSIHDQWRNYTGWGNQQYGYDAAGRLTVVFDTMSAQCTIRLYAHDANSNRTSLRTIPPLAGGACNYSGLGTTTTSTYDSGDRLTSSGVTYDGLARTSALPAGSAGGQALTAQYFVNDMVASLTQGGTAYSYVLDPLDRLSARGTTGSRTLHFADDGDSPTWTAENPAGTTYTRNIAGVDGDLAAIFDSATGQAKLQFANPHGDIGATAASATSTTYITDAYDADEFGVPRLPAPRYGWLGADERQAEYATGTTLMGVRVYQPHLGRFLQADPVEGGSCNAYEYVCSDPLSSFDLDGRQRWGRPWGRGTPGSAPFGRTGPSYGRPGVVTRARTKACIGLTCVMLNLAQPITKIKVPQPPAKVNYPSQVIRDYNERGKRKRRGGR